MHTYDYDKNEIGASYPTKLNFIYTKQVSSNINIILDTRCPRNLSKNYITFFTLLSKLNIKQCVSRSCLYPLTGVLI